jgi:aspartyl-tRNA synthetase
VLVSEIRQFLRRTHTCGELRGPDVGKSVVLTGWVHNRRDHGGAIFIDLRDRYGLTQVVFRQDQNAATHGLAEELRSEYCISVAGRVDSRGDNVNPKMPTGEIEVSVTELFLFSRSQTPPFEISDHVETHEGIRLAHRYLDLRRPSVQRNFVLRSRAYSAIRGYLESQGFLELETPYMVKNTPGGARNFLVPSRLNRHEFYALAESPQLYKQLFMVAGFDRYYQIVRCFRDEDQRGDRQPEFTQIDLELSFVDEELIFSVVEGLMQTLFRHTLDIEIPTPFPRLTYDEALRLYGSDKPDLRFGLTLTDLTDLARTCGFRIFEEAAAAGGIVKTLRLPDRAKDLSRKDLDSLAELVKPVGAKGVAYVRVQPDGVWQAPFAKAFRDETRLAVNERAGAVPGDVLLFLADKASVANNALSTLRLHMATKFGLIGSEAKAKWCPLWITEFPLLEISDETGAWVACHHPFTSPREQDLELLLGERRGEARARAYDLVLNGVEVAGGSIRIHSEDVQQKVFAAIGLSEEVARAKFSFLLEAFRYGPPPHGGIAFGLDRLMMLLCGAESLRDVIAFPKTQKGTCPLTGAPTAADEKQLEALHIMLRP